VTPTIDFGGLPWFEGIIDGLDRQAKSIRVRVVSPESRSTIYLRDDTTLQIPPGVRMRFDDYLDSNSGFPFGLGDKVQLSYRTNPTTKMTSAVAIVRVK
jgi:hypothetical protein